VNVYAKIKCTTDRHIAMGCIIIQQDDDIVSVISKAAALKLADQIRDLANSFWEDDPRPTDGHIGKDGYYDLINRGD